MSRVWVKAAIPSWTCQQYEEADHRNLTIYLISVFRSLKRKDQTDTETLSYLTADHFLSSIQLMCLLHNPKYLWHLPSSQRPLAFCQVSRTLKVPSNSLFNAVTPLTYGKLESISTHKKNAICKYRHSYLDTCMYAFHSIKLFFLLV